MNYLKLFLSVLTITCFACIACGDNDDLCTEITWYQDADGDGLGNPDAPLLDCQQPTGYVSNSDDTDDVCSGTIDICGVCDGNGEITWFQDADGDGLGNPDVSQVACDQPTGYVANSEDANDNGSDYIGSGTVTQGSATVSNDNIYACSNGRNAPVGNITSSDGTEWTVPAAINFEDSDFPFAADLYNPCTGVTFSSAAVAVAALDGSDIIEIDADGEVITGYIFADNYFELYINGVAVGKDNVPFTQFNSNLVRFKVNRPFTIAMKLVDWEENSGLGSEDNQGVDYHPGDGGMVAVFKDAADNTIATTSSAWKAQTFYTAPIKDLSCLSESGTTRSSDNCDTDGTNDGASFYAVHWAIPTDWTSASFDDSNWPAATTYTNSTIGVDNKSAYTNFTDIFDDSAADAEFIWSTNVILDNEVIVRYTVPGDGSSGTGTENDRYNAAVFSEVSLTSDVAYGMNTTQAGVATTLLMDIYEPTGDTETSRPLVILAHGGGFTGGSKTNNSIVKTAEYLAKSGYVVASISYRLIDAAGDNAFYIGAIDAIHDMKAAIRFLRKDQATTNTYRIDTDNIFIGGSSAGATTSVQAAYMNSIEEIEGIDANFAALFKANGGLEGTSGNADYASNFKAVINISGAILSLDLIDEGDPAIVSVHGVEDTVVPIDFGENDGSGVSLYGSARIHEQADAVGVTNTLLAIEGGSHSVYNSCDDAVCKATIRSFLFSLL